MISSNIRYPFGRKVATVETPSFNCMIKTAKESLFSKQSTVFSIFGAGIISHRHVARLLFYDHLDATERLRLHDIIVGVIDEAGTNGKSLRDALMELFESIEREGIGHGQLLQD